MTQIERKTGYNRRLAKMQVQWLNQALCFDRNFCLLGSEVLRTRHLGVATYRYAQC